MKEQNVVAIAALFKYFECKSSLFRVIQSSHVVMLCLVKKRHVDTGALLIKGCGKSDDILNSYTCAEMSGKYLL